MSKDGLKNSLGLHFKTAWHGKYNLICVHFPLAQNGGNTDLIRGIRLKYSRIIDNLGTVNMGVCLITYMEVQFKNL